MPKIPRDVKGLDLANLLRSFGYEITRQTGSHIRVSRSSPKGEHHLTIPVHSPLKIGTLSAILSDVADNLNLSKAELIDQLFG